MIELRTSSGLLEPVDVSEYLYKRLHQLGVRSVHGVPGDYNLVALDYLSKSGLQWVGSVNELNAGTCHMLDQRRAIQELLILSPRLCC